MSGRIRDVSLVPRGASLSGGWIDEVREFSQADLDELQAWRELLPPDVRGRTITFPRYEGTNPATPDEVVLPLHIDTAAFDAALRDYRLPPLAEVPVYLPTPNPLEDAIAHETLGDTVRRLTREAVRAKDAIAHLSLAIRRDRLAHEVLDRYGVTLHPHSWMPDAVVVSETDHEALLDGIRHDPGLTAIGQGYYYGLGGALRFVIVPDWTCDPLRVSLARLYAVSVLRPLRPAVRALNALLLRLGYALTPGRDRT